MRKLRTLHEFLMERFTSDWEEAIGYLDVALEEYQEDGDTPFFLLGLENVIEAHGGVTGLAKQTGIEPEVLSEMLSSEKAPRLDTLNTILQGLGCRLSVQPLKDANSSADKNYSVVPKEGTDPHLEVTTGSSDSVN